MYRHFLHKVCRIALLCVACISIIGCDQSNPSDVAGSPEVRIGAPAPDFTLENMHGDEVSLSELRGKTVLVNFWATWCPPCRQEMPSMEKLYQHFHGRAFEMLAINVEQNGAEAVADFLGEKSHSFPILFDPQAKVQRLYNVSKFPETFVVDKNGVVVEHVVGAIDWMQPSVVGYLENL